LLKTLFLSLLLLLLYCYYPYDDGGGLVVVVVMMMFQMQGSLKHPARLSEMRNLRYKATNKAWRSWGQVALYLYIFSTKSSACHDHGAKKKFGVPDF